MTIKIEQAANGYIVKSFVDGKLDQTAVVSDDGGEPEAALMLLHLINDLLGNTGSRYDEKRIKISLEAGDKHPLHPNNQEDEEISALDRGCGAC